MHLYLAITFAFLALYILPVAIAVFRCHKQTEKITIGALSVVLWPAALLVAITE